MLVRAAIDLVPDCIATKLGFEGMTLPATWRFAVVAMAKAVNIPIAGSPPTEACKRMGLAANYLYR
jgi:hypothetical protein